MLARNVAAHFQMGDEISADEQESVMYTPAIDHEKQIYPHCIVWTPLPGITWFLPFIGKRAAETT